jgi:hypothetical protein
MIHSRVESYEVPIYIAIYSTLFNKSDSIVVRALVLQARYPGFEPRSNCTILDMNHSRVEECKALPYMAIYSLTLLSLLLAILSPLCAETFLVPPFPNFPCDTMTGATSSGGLCYVRGCHSCRQCFLADVTYFLRWDVGHDAIWEDLDDCNHGWRC